MRRPGERIAASFVAFVVLAGGTGIASSGDRFSAHPLHAWLATGPGTAGMRFDAAAACAGIAVALAATFGLTFRKVLSR